jgi:hypothetical protein
VNGSAALAGIVLAQRFGRDAETDGFLAAYGVYLVLILAAQAFRLVVVPELTGAAAEERLGSETTAWAVALAAVGAPVTLGVVVFAGPVGDVLTGALPPSAAEAAASALPWLVPAAFLQLFASLAASALAALDSYAVAAFAYAAGAAAGLATFLAGGTLDALAWGLALNGAIALAVPVAVLAAPGARPGAGALAFARRLGRLAQGAALPLALQGLYLVALRLAAGLGPGEVTTLSYAYLISAAFVAATASSLSLVAAAPLTRRGVDAEHAAAHVVHSSWLSLAAVAGAAGIFAVAGGQIARVALGEAFFGEVGHELGRLVVELAPWTAGFAAFAVAYPLVFVLRRARVLVPLALASLVCMAATGLGLRAAFGLPGIGLALALVTWLVVAGLLAAVSPRTLVLALGRLTRLGALVAALAAVAFGPLAVLVGGIPAALGGLAVYALLLAALRPAGLRDGWAYVRALHEPAG